MNSKAALLVLAADWTVSAAAAEPRCPLIPMGAITGKPDEQTVMETLEAYPAENPDFESRQYAVYQHYANDTVAEPKGTH